MNTVPCHICRQPAVAWAVWSPVGAITCLDTTCVRTAEARGWTRMKGWGAPSRTLWERNHALAEEIRERRGQLAWTLATALRAPRPSTGVTVEPVTEPAPPAESTTCPNCKGYGVVRAGGPRTGVPYQSAKGARNAKASKPCPLCKGLRPLMREVTESPRGTTVSAPRRHGWTCDRCGQHLPSRVPPNVRGDDQLCADCL